MGSVLSFLKNPSVTLGELCLWFLKLMTGLFLNLVLVLALQVSFSFNQFIFIFLMVTLTGLFLGITRTWTFLGIIVFDLFLVLLGLVLKMYVHLAPG